MFVDCEVLYWVFDLRKMEKNGYLECGEVFATLKKDYKRLTSRGKKGSVVKGWSRGVILVSGEVFEVE